ncbi:MAG: acetyl-CoA C-acyltransferase [Pseudomonadota bacterium]
MTDVFLYDAVRTPRGKGKPDGALSEIAPHELVRQLIGALSARLGPETPRSIDRLILSTVGQVGPQGGHLALVTKLASGLPHGVSAMTVNNFCAGGLSALHTAANEVRAGAAELVLAAGVECMSQVPFLADKASYYTDPELSDRLAYVPVALSADYMAHREGLSRETLDEITHRSHQRAAAAWAAGAYEASVVPATHADGTLALAEDECIRASMTLEKLASMPPAFEAEGAKFDPVAARSKPDLADVGHVMTVAHCPPIADGAAVVLLGGRKAGRRLGIEPIARVRATQEAAGDPVDQLTAGFAAMEAVLVNAGLRLEDIDLIEFMEAFAPPPAKFLRDYDVDPERVNVNGGHLAMGHPMGATGLVLTATLAHEMRRRDAALGLAVAHGGSGVGSALVLERV